MKELYAKRDQLRDQISALRADLKTIEAAIRVIDGAPVQNRLFKRGHLQRLVSDAMRADVQGNAEIARYVMDRMGWECTDDALRDMTRQVKDVTKRL